MRNILVYEDTAEKLEKIAEERDTTTAELIDLLMDFINEI